MTTEQRYEALIQAYRDHKAPKRSTLPQGQNKVAQQIQRELFLLAAQRFIDDTSSASKWALNLCTETVMRTALTKFYGRSLRTKSSDEDVTAKLT